MRKTTGSPFIGFFFLALLISVPLPFIFLFFSRNWYAIGHGYSLAMLFGVTSYCFFCCTLVLSTRVRFLDRRFGQDKILRLHGYLAAIAIGTGSIHCILKSGSMESVALQVVPGIAGLSLSIFIALVTFFYMTGGLLSAVPLFSRLRMFVSERFRLDYSRAKLFHNIFCFAVACVLIHGLSASSTQESLSRVLCMCVFGGVVLLRYFYHKLLRPIVNRTRDFYLVKIEKPALNIVRLTFRSRNQKRMLFQAGQFAYLKIISPETGTEEHPFSFSSSPTDPDLRMTIKSVGDYTTRLGNLEEGTRVILDGPYGSFIPRADDRNKVFIAGGIGITPLLSVLSSWRALKQAPKTILFWSAGNKEDLIDSRFFERMGEECPWFSFIPMLTREHGSRYRHGRITPELIAGSGALENRLKTDFYLCGPQPMIRDLKRFLIAEGIPKRNIHYELFVF